jgi:hypothetical protein
MFKNRMWRVFLAGVFCGIIFTLAVGAASLWWKTSYGSPDERGAARSAENDVNYDMCLAAGNTNVACDALIRMLRRFDAAETAMQEEVTKMLATGANKCDVANWGYKHGFVGSQMSKAIGVSMEELYKCLPGNN